MSHSAHTRPGPVGQFLSRRRRPKLVIAGAAFGALALAGGAAFAAYVALFVGTVAPTPGTGGTTAAPSEVNQALTIYQGTNSTFPDVPALTVGAPGAAAVPIDFVVSNTSANTVQLQGVSVAITSVSNGDQITSLEPCTASMFTVTDGTVSGANNGDLSAFANGSDFTSGDGMTLWNAPTIALTDDGNNQDNCGQPGVAVSLTLSMP